MNKTSQAASHMGKIGGKRSAEKRLSHLTKEQTSELMRKVRLTPRQKALSQKMTDEVVANLNKNVSAE